MKYWLLDGGDAGLDVGQMLEDCDQKHEVETLFRLQHGRRFAGPVINRQIALRGEGADGRR